MPSTGVLLFGDQTTAIVKTIESLSSHSRNSALLDTFLRRSFAVLKVYNDELLQGSNNRLYTSVLDIAEAYAKAQEQRTQLSSALLCVAQLGSTILQWDLDQKAINHGDHDQTIVGLCTGLLPAAFIAASTSVGHLVQIGPDCVEIAVRVGIEAYRRSYEIEPGSKEWTRAITRITLEEAQTVLDAFNSEKALPQHRQAYVSAVGDCSGVTVSGPPTIISVLFEQGTSLASYPSSKLGITAAYHASHLGTPDIEKIFHDVKALDLPIRNGTKLVSTSSGHAYEGFSLRDVLKSVVDDIFQQPLRLDLVVQHLAKCIKDSDVLLTVFGHCGLTKSIQQALTSNGNSIRNVDEAQNAKPRHDEYHPDSIAVVGMSGRFPGGDTIDEFWHTIVNGKDLHTKVPKDRFDTLTHCDPSGKTKNSTLSAFGCFINDPGMFDTRLFNMSPREAAQTDPSQRQLLMVTYEALESAGYVQDGTPESLNVGTFFGVTADDYREYNSSQDIDVYYVTGGLRAFVPGRLNYHFKWEGPSFSLDTACSSSAAAIDLACQSLLAGKCSMAVAGGTNIMTGPNLYAGLSRGGFLSPTGSSKTFDDTADGYCRGDAIGAIVLKRLSDAVQAGDKIRGIIRSAGTNHSAYASSITLPHSPSQKKLFDQILRETSLGPEAVSYVELHGTGTQAGDTIEMNSVLSTFGANRSASNPLYVGAVKANVGHGEGAAGVTSAIKAMLMFREGIIPPHAGIKTRVNTKFPPLHEANVRIARSAEKFVAAADGKRRVWINNFNATGGNTCLVLEEPPKRILGGTDPRTHHVITVSAKTAYSLRENQRRLHNYLSVNIDQSLSDIAYTTTAKKTHHNIRAAYVAGSADELIQALARDLASANKPPTAGDQKPIVFSFAGQGTQYSGMGKQLFETSARFRDTVLEHDALCKKLGLPPFIDAITGTSTDTANASTTKDHCALLSLEIALAHMWSSWGVAPSVVLGHSIGEYAALAISGVLSLADAFFLVAKRGELLDKHCEKHSHVMVLVNANPDRITELLKSAEPAQTWQVSCINASESIVISMPSDTFSSITGAIERAGIKSTKLKMPFAYHSTQMDALLADFKSLASGVHFNAPRIPVVSTLLAQTVTTHGVFTADYLMRQTRDTVNFLAAVQTTKTSHPDAIWLEHGPDVTCASSIRKILGNRSSTVTTSLRGAKEDCWRTISKILTQLYNDGVHVEWKSYHQEYVKALQLVDLPTYAFDLKNYWLQYEGTWALEKNHHRCPEPKEIIRAVAPTPIVSDFTSTCLQQIEFETWKEDTATVEFASDLTKPGIYDLISGHFVNGVGLCPSAVYTDMALTAAKYIYTKLRPSDAHPAMDVRDFEIFRPLVLRGGEESHIVKVSATKSADSDTIQITVNSQLGSISQSHARCSVEFGDGLAWARSWARNSYLVSDRITHLRSPLADVAIDTLRGAMVYKIFSEIVEYPEGYKGIQEFTMNGSLNEAVAKVEFRKTPTGTTFTCDPCWIDTIAQVPGFVLNGSTSTPPELVFLSTGWESMRITKALSAGTEYSCYVRMQRSDSPGLLLGDASLFEGDHIVAVATGLKFHEVRKDTLHRVLPGSRNLSAQSSTANSIDKSSSAVPKEAVLSSLKPKVKTKIEAPRVQRENIPRVTSVFPQVLQSIAQEVGVGLDDLSDDAIFEDLGVDSLLTISIGTKLKDELQLDIPLTLFSECESVAQLRQYFQTHIDTVEVEPRSSDEGSSSEDYGNDGETSSATSVSEDGSPNGDIVEVIIAAIVKESGLSEDEIDADTDFVDLGVDSLMTIAVLGAVLTQTGEQLAASLFSDYPTVSALRKGLGRPKPVAQKHSESQPSSIIPRASGRPSFQAESYRSNTVLLQGDSKSALPPMFFIADGAGSAASYLHFPQFPSRLPVYALESPFLNCPSEYTCSIEEICQTYTAAIRATRPHGPYFLGGWSIGGIYAYETMRQLISLGERVEGVLIIDSPCPHKMEGLPPLTMEILEETGIFVGIPVRGGGPDAPMPLGQKQHIVGCVQAASSYDPKPLSIHQRPSHTYIIWSERGLFEQLSEKVKEASDQQAGTTEKTGINRDWLTGTRTSFGPKGWDQLLGECECHPTEGDHFSCMNQPRIKTTGKLVADAIEKFLLKMTMTTSTKAAPVVLKTGTCQTRPANLAHAQTVFDRVRMQTVAHMKSTGFDGFWTHVYPVQRRLVLAYVVEAFAELGISLQTLAAGEPVRDIAHIPQHTQLIPQLYRILEDGQLITSEKGSYSRTSNAVDTTSSRALYEQLQSRFPQHEAEHKLLDIAGSRFAGVLSGKVDFLRILFQENRDLLAKVYTYAPMFDATSRQLSDFLFELCKDVPAGEEVRILEIGGGLGGTTRPVVDMLIKHNIPFSYTFSDISGSLVANARKTFAGTPNMTFTALDVEKEPAAKFQGKFNVIFSTNCVHATRNLYTSTKNIRSMLRPDGLLALVEFTENIFWFDIVFGLLEGWWLFEDARPHVLASERFWRDSLNRAGFGQIALTEGPTRECQTLRIIAAFQP